VAGERSPPARGPEETMPSSSARLNDPPPRSRARVGNVPAECRHKRSSPALTGQRSVGAHRPPRLSIFPRAHGPESEVAVWRERADDLPPRSRARVAAQRHDPDRRRSSPALTGQRGSCGDQTTPKSIFPRAHGPERFGVCRCVEKCDLPPRSRARAFVNSADTLELYSRAKGSRGITPPE